MVDPRKKPDLIRMTPHSPLVLSKTRPDFWLHNTCSRLSNGARVFVDNSGFNTGDGLALSTSDHFIDFWIRTGSPTLSQPIFYAGSGNSASGLFVFTTASGFITFRDGFGASGHWAEVTTNTNALTEDTWAYYCITVNRATRAISVYHNGVATPIRTGTVPSAADGESFTSSVTTYISTLSPGTRDFALAGLGIGIGSLPTTAEIAERWNSGVVLPYASLSAGLQAKYSHFWDLNETSGNAIAQVGGRNGTQYGTVGFAKGPGKPDTPADGSSCGYLTTKDANAIVVSQATPATMPTIDDGTGEAGLAFNGSQYLSAASVPVTGQSFDCLVTFKTGAAFSADQYLFSFSKLSVANVYGGVGINASGNPFTETYDGTTRIRVTGNSVFDTESVYALQVTNSGSAISMRVVGKAADEILTETVGTNNGTWAADMTGLNTFTVGGLRISSGNTLFTGTISEIRLYDTQQPVTLMSQMRARIVATIVALSIPLWVLTHADATLLASGATEYQLGTPAHFYAWDGDYDYTQVSGSAVDAIIASDGNDKRPYIMDLEVFEVGGDITDINDLLADGAQRAWTLGQMNTVVNKWKATPRHFGWYGTVPEQRDNYWTYINYLNNGEGTSYADVFYAWRTANGQNAADLQLNECSHLCPVLYAFYNQEWNQWEDFAKGMCYEAHRLANGKPVWPFMWAMYHPAGVGGAIALETWNSMVEFVASLPVVDGIVAWTQDGDTPAAGWRDVLVEQMTGRVAVAPPVVVPPA